MDKRTLVRIKEDSFEILELYKDSFKIYFFDKKEDFYKVLSKKRNIYITFLPKDIYKEEISISSAIKNSSTIEKILSINLKKKFNDELVFKYELKEKDEVHNKNIYQIEAIKKRDILDIINSIPNRADIKTITTDFHSLSSISSEIINDSFISIFVEDGHIIYVACEKGKILFFRESFLYFDNPLLKNETISSDISRTILFIKQQNRFVDFKNLIISGDIFNEEEIFSNLQDLGLNISIPIDLKYKEKKEYIKNFIIFGLLHIKKEYNFEPIEIKSQKQYRSIFLVLNLLLFFPIFYLIYQNIISYLNFIEKENILQERRSTLARLEKDLDLMDIKDLNFYISYLNIKNRSLKDEIISSFSPLNPIFLVIKPIKIDADIQKVKLSFQKRFDSLKSLINLKKDFENILENIKKNIQIQSKIDIDFKNLEFKATLIVEREKK